MLLSKEQTLVRALDFAGDMILGNWNSADGLVGTDHMDLTVTSQRAHYIECQTCTAVIAVCTITGAIDNFKFTHKGDA